MSVGALFCELWVEAEKATPSQRELADTLWPSARARLTAVVRQDDPGQICGQLAAYIVEKSNQRLGAVLAVMRAIDAAFDPVHPRSIILAPGRIRPVIPEWLDEADAVRQREGRYFANKERVLVPRGPLTRWGASQEGASADTLINRFKFLTVASTQTTERGRPIFVTTKVVNQDAIKGVPPSPQNGSEIVHFAPLAEDEGDLMPQIIRIDGKAFLKVEPSAALTPGQRLFDLALQSGGIDLILAPELAMTSVAALELSEALRRETRPVPRIIVSGSALTEEKCTADMSWNEATVFNRYGKSLWKQRKLVPYRMTASSAVAHGLLSLADKVDLPEYIESGDTIEVADIDGFGRAVIFICEDFGTVGPVEQILDQFQPDWVLVPILDTGVKETRWPHLRGFALSSIGQSRFMITSSLSMCYWREVGDPAPTTFPPVGVAIGPRDIVAGDSASPPLLARAFAPAELPSGIAPRFARVQWNVGRWHQTSVTVETPRTGVTGA